MVSLPETHAASSRKNGKPGIPVGDVVLLQNDSTKRVLWKLAIVKELLPGSDDRIRAAVVQVAASRTLLKISIKDLIRVEVKSNADALTVPGGPIRFEELPNAEPDVINRPHRGAAINGELLRTFRSSHWERFRNWNIFAMLSRFLNQVEKLTLELNLFVCFV